MLNGLRALLTRWFGPAPQDASAAPAAPRMPARENEPSPTVLHADDAPARQPVAYDENLLERARTQWQFGDWDSLARLDRDTLQHHPDRAKLALLAAAGRLQTHRADEARQFIRLAQDWGVSKKLVAQILTAGVHNSLGRAAALSNKPQRALQHFEAALSTGAPGGDARLLTQARAMHQMAQLTLPEMAMAQPLFAGVSSVPQRSNAPTVPAKPTSHGFIEFGVTLPDGRSRMLAFNPNIPTFVSVEHGMLHFDVPDGKVVYLCSNPDGDFGKPPPMDQFKLEPETGYVLSGAIDCEGHHPVIWAIEYDEHQRIASHNETAQGNRFALPVATDTNHANLCLAIRLSGKGVLNPAKTSFRISAQSDEAVLFQKGLDAALKKVTQQVEAFLDVQTYLATGKHTPAMHGWPISPDLAKYMIERVEKVNYDLIIEFGSGTSTVLFARAMAERRMQNSAPHPQLSNRGDGLELTAEPRIISFEHLDKYQALTLQQLEEAGLSAQVQLVLAPLDPYTASDGAEYRYYRCHETLMAVARRFSVPDLHVLVFVDGPPAATCEAARYPALAHVLSSLRGARIDVLMDDYIRDDEKLIARRWRQELDAQGLAHKFVEMKFEKDACPFEIDSATSNQGKQ